MPPSVPEPASGSDSSLSLLVKWRSETFTIPAPPSLTVQELKSQLSVLTNVPPDRQKLLFPSAKKSTDDTQLLTALFRDGKLPTRPLMLLGTPAAPGAHAPPEEDHPNVVDDLDDLLKPPVAPLPPPRVPHPPYRPLRSSVFERLSPDFQQRILSQVEDPEDLADLTNVAPLDIPEAAWQVPPEERPAFSFRPPHEDLAATNGATLSLESLDEALRGAQTGMPFITERMSRRWMSPWNGADVDGFMDAVSRSRQRLYMLAVIMFDFSGAAEASEKLLRTTVEQPSVRGVLDRAFQTLPADLGTLEDGGAELLRRLGLHAAPVVIVLADVGVSVSIVDMFNTEWFGDVESEEGAAALAMRFEETVANFDGFYGPARARRDAIDGREQMIREQDQALEAAAAADREREERERAAVEERRRREEEEERERRRREEEQRRREDETEEAKRNLPTEPDSGGAKVVLRLPDGRRVERSFQETDYVRDVFNLAVSEGVQKGSFELRSMFPRRVFTEEDGGESLRNAGFVPSVILNVEH